MKHKISEHKSVYYLSHPVAPDDKYTVPENLDHTVKVLGIFFDAGYRVIAPWHSLCLRKGDELMQDDDEYREKCLVIDCDVVELCDGVILVGHKISKGMQRELEAHTNIINLVSIPDVNLIEHFDAYVKSL